jgi:polysaccharide export outer membrane protein
MPPRLLGLFMIAASILMTQAVAHSQLSHPQESLLLSPGDLIHVMVFDVPELEQHLRIADSGEVTLALVGKVAIAGLAPAQAEQKISSFLASGGYMLHAQLSVLVEQYAAASISVSGQVQHPGSYPVTTPRNLMDVLSMAGGLTPAADIHITVKRRAGQGETVYAALPNDADTALLNSILVYPGDLVVVPKAGIVYVLGDVIHPGGYVMTDDAQLTVMQVIALAAGTTKTASENHARLLRQTANGPVDIPLSLKAMEKGTQPDLSLKPEDVIYIPYSTGKNIMLGASSILSSTGGAAIYAAR